MKEKIKKLINKLIDGVNKFMDKIMERLNKLSLPAVILIASIILGGFYYASQVSKQRSIEKQQQIELRLKTEQETKNYAAKRKTDCLAIYKTEGDKWNNVRGWRYDEDSDLCYITYKNPNPKSKSQCEKELSDSKAIFSPDPVPPIIFSSYLHCVEGTFENGF